jgi:hypothetical protein
MKSSTTLSSSSSNSPPEYQVVLDDLLLEKRCARPGSEDESRTGRALGRQQAGCHGLDVPLAEPSTTLDDTSN